MRLEKTTSSVLSVLLLINGLINIEFAQIVYTRKEKFCFKVVKSFDITLMIYIVK